MAQLTVYVNEPATRGKLILHTSLGPLDVELWSKEAPLACRNFVQLCLEGYYDGLIFHRVIKGFMAQAGDPTGTGTGGESVYGGPFKDEVHGRLRFTHRGIVAMASNGPDTNGSQFFITLDRCEWLEGKHTIFGKVTGNSLYNLTRFDELETEANDRPLYPPRIESTEILLEPFDDIVPRPKLPPPPAAEPQKKKRKEKKNLNLLSFGEEAAEEERMLAQVETKVVSSHDALADPRLSKEQAVDTEELAQKLRKKKETDSATAAFKARAGGGTDDAADRADDFTERMREQMQQRRQRLQAASQSQAEPAGDRVRGGGAAVHAAAAASGDGDDEAEDAGAEYERLRREVTAAKRDEKSGWKWRGKGGGQADSDEDESDDEGADGGLSVLEQRRAKYLQKKRQHLGLTKKQRQEATLHKLGVFKKTLGDSAPPDAEWKSHALKYEKETREAESASVYESVDPLKHGADESRALAKIKEREKTMLSMKRGWEEDE